MKGICWDCKRKRNLFYAVWRRCGGAIERVCKECWLDYDYEPFMRRKGAV